VFRNVKARMIYKFIDCNDSSKMVERNKIGGFDAGSTHCELLNYFILRRDGGIYCKATLDICTNGYESAGFGSYLAFYDWTADNSVTFSDLTAGFRVAMVFLAELKKGVVIFMENESAGYHVYSDWYLHCDKAMIGCYVAHKDKMLMPADRLEINQCIYVFEAKNADEVKTFYSEKIKGIVNVNPSYADFKVFASDSRIVIGGFGG